ncbi:MAG: hypothetical protein LQ347_003565 [Umbilicaria vellea]|nr:MAG: hypothetical protein LQ347_003565 [Umbilicaria vellea]
MSIAPNQNVTLRSQTIPLRITNLCAEVIWPAVGTQHGTGPNSQGFQLKSGESKDQAVSADFQGRVWGRTNCTFNAEGTGPSNDGGLNGAGESCKTGDCAGLLDCRVTVRCEANYESAVDFLTLSQGNIPTTLAEFTLAAAGKTFYDVSLVDGYNLPMAIVSLNNESGIASLMDIPPNLTNPICIATAAQLAERGSTLDQYLGSNDSYPLPLEQSVSYDFVQSWCPWDLQLSPPTTSANGVYPYPDGTLDRPAFNPCYSACGKYNYAHDCCVEPYNSASTCKPSTYSNMAKKVCPDAYSYAFDDQTSTFIVPSGGGFEVIFCPAGRSSNILATSSAELLKLAALRQVQE